MPAVRKGSPLRKKSKYVRLKNYINQKKYNLVLWIAKVSNDYMIREKFAKVFSLIINTLFTGALIYYIVKNDNFISYGLALMLALYYLDVVVQIIKKPYPTNK